MWDVSRALKCIFDDLEEEIKHKREAQSLRKKLINLQYAIFLEFGRMLWNTSIKEVRNHRFLIWMKVNLLCHL